MTNIDELSDDQIQKIVDYALKLYKYSAEESLSTNDEKGYERLCSITSRGNEIECQIDSSMVALDPDDIGEGDGLCVSMYAQDPDSDEKVHIADVYLTEEGMLDGLGTVVWFPDTDQWFK